MGCGLKATTATMTASESVCTTDLCNAAVRPGMTTATSAVILFAAVAKYIFA